MAPSWLRGCGVNIEVMKTSEFTKEAREKAEEGVKETAQQLTAAGQKWGAKAKDAIRDTGAAADLYLHEYAWTSLALFVAAAGLIGYWLGVRRR